MITTRPLYLVGDFETTVYDGQERTDVWAAACVELYTEDVLIFGSIDQMFRYLCSLERNVIIYFHNLKFDGAFWLNFLKSRTDYQEAFVTENPDKCVGHFIDRQYMKSKTYTYAISDMGQWYKITIKTSKWYIEIRDSLKLLPFSVKKLGKDFKLKHQKLEMEYTGYRYPNCPISDEEKEYIANDVLVVKEAIEIMFDDGHKKLTIGSCCLDEYKRTSQFYDYDLIFPNLYELDINPKQYGSSTAGAYIRKAYRGGWCYVVPEKRSKLLGPGTTADVNSLYPSMMHSESGNVYPVGSPVFWEGDFIPEEAKSPNHYYFLRVKTRFNIKKNHLPFIQIKDDHAYKGNECLTTSDRISRITGERCEVEADFDGILHPITVTLTLTQTDWQLLQDHYNLSLTKILDGCYFTAKAGIFDEYIDKYRKIKIESKGAQREEAKLFLNNLYGKMATSPDSPFKVARLNENGALSFFTVRMTEDVTDFSVDDIKALQKKPGYIPIGAAITSYARNFTIRAAQKNYHGPNKAGFIYADTDSIHCDLPPDKIKGIKVHNTAFCAWKLESCWDYGFFVRQKAYLEHITHENLEPLDERDQYTNLKCAGMPELPKQLFLLSMNPLTKQILDDQDMYDWLLPDWGVDALDFLREKTRTVQDFKVGLKVPGKLKPVNIAGGVLLMETTYTMRESFI